MRSIPRTFKSRNSISHGRSVSVRLAVTENCAATREIAPMTLAAAPHSIAYKVPKPAIRNFISQHVCVKEQLTEFLFLNEKFCFSSLLARKFLIKWRRARVSGAEFRAIFDDAWSLKFQCARRVESREIFTATGRSAIATLIFFFSQKIFHSNSLLSYFSCFLNNTFIFFAYYRQPSAACTRIPALDHSGCLEKLIRMPKHSFRCGLWITSEQHIKRFQFLISLFFTRRPFQNFWFEIHAKGLAVIHLAALVKPKSRDASYCLWLGPVLYPFSRNFRPINKKIPMIQSKIFSSI